MSEGLGFGVTSRRRTGKNVASYMCVKGFFFFGSKVAGIYMC